MSVFTKAELKAFKKPWPPGKTIRSIKTRKLGGMLQLRDGAFSPTQLYFEIVHRGARMGPN